MKRKRERYTKQSSILSKLVRQLSIHDNRAAAASGWSDSGSGPGISFLLLLLAVIVSTEGFWALLIVSLRTNIGNWQ